MTDDAKGLKVAIVGTGASNMHALAALAGKELKPDPIKYPVTAMSVVSGPHGRAWLCDTAAGYRQLGADPSDGGDLAHWIVEAPWAHPAWHSYSIVLVHLRPLRTPRKTLFYLEDATHEIWVVAINPDADRNTLLMNGIIKDQWLSPSNFAAQFIEVSDDLARDRVKRAVIQICDGNLSPDTDFTSMWAGLFGDNMLKDRPNKRPPKERVI